EDSIRDDLVTGVQTCALPIYAATADSLREIPERRLVRPEGIEPPAYRFEACRSIHLSYGRLRLWASNTGHLIIALASICHPSLRSEERRVGRESRCWRLSR